MEGGNDAQVPNPREVAALRDIIDVLREQRGWSLQRLASTADFSSPQHLHRKLTGQVRWQPDEVARVARALNQSPMKFALILWPMLEDRPDSPEPVAPDQPPPT